MASIRNFKQAGTGDGPRPVPLPQGPGRCPDASHDLVSMVGGGVERDDDLSLMEAQLLGQRGYPRRFRPREASQPGGDLAHVGPTGESGSAPPRAGLEHDAGMCRAGQSLAHEALDQVVTVVPSNWGTEPAALPLPHVGVVDRVPVPTPSTVKRTSSPFPDKVMRPPGKEGSRAPGRPPLRTHHPADHPAPPLEGGGALLVGDARVEVDPTLPSPARKPHGQSATSGTFVPPMSLPSALPLRMSSADRTDSRQRWQRGASADHHGALRRGEGPLS